MLFSWSDVCAPGGNAAAQKVESIVSRENGEMRPNRGFDEASNPLDIGWRFTKHGGEPQCLRGWNELLARVKGFWGPHRGLNCRRCPETDRQYSADDDQVDDAVSGAIGTGKRVRATRFFVSGQATAGEHASAGTGRGSGRPHSDQDGLG